MAVMSKVNAALRKAYPKLDIEAVRCLGHGYVYFAGKDGAEVVDSLFMHPLTVSTAVLTEHVLYQVADVHGPHGIITPDEYKEVLTDLITWLEDSGLTHTPDGGVPPLTYKGTEYSVVTNARRLPDRMKGGGQW
jgi:hypothetical protein